MSTDIPLSLTSALTWLLSGGLGLVAYRLLVWLDLHTDFHLWRRDVKELATIGLFVLVPAIGGWGATWGLIWLEAAAKPDRLQGWAAALWTCIALSLVAALSLRSRDLAPTVRAQLARQKADRNAHRRARSRLPLKEPLP